VTMSRYCASSLDSIRHAANAVRAGQGDTYIAAGVEWVSRYNERTEPAGAADQNKRLQGKDGTPNAYIDMGITAVNVAKRYEVSRADMDKFALRSHELAVQATDEGRLPEEIVPVTISSKKGDTTVEIDEAPRRDSSLETLSKLRGAFHKDGAHTAGNAPGVNDGAGALVITSDEYAKSHGLEVLATIVAQGYVADEFAYLARTPAKAGAIALEKAGKTIDDVERVELNEAFSSVVLNSTKLLGADPEKVNVNGGAVALGHPIGASGARVLVTLLAALRDAGKRRGVASLCIGGGEGIALAVEMTA